MVWRCRSGQSVLTAGQAVSIVVYAGDSIEATNVMGTVKGRLIVEAVVVPLIDANTCGDFHSIRLRLAHLHRSHILHEEAVFTIT